MSPQTRRPRTAKQHLERAQQEREHAAVLLAQRTGHQGHLSRMAQIHEELAIAHEKKAQELRDLETSRKAERLAAKASQKTGRPILDWSLVPGTTRDQVAAAHRVSRPIKIEKTGPKWSMIVLGVPIGQLDTKEAARSAAHTIGRYKLDLGDFVSMYTEGY